MANRRELERAVIRAALRWYDFQEKHAPLTKAKGYPQLEPMRWADDATHDKIEALEQKTETAIARLAKARKKPRRRVDRETKR